MDQNTAARILTGAALAGITLTYVQTLRLSNAKSKLRSSERAAKFWENCFEDSLKQMSAAQVLALYKNQKTRFQFEDITKNM